MVILFLGAFRFSGLQADVPSLPLNVEAGAIFDAVDSVRKYVFDGGAWNEFVAGGGEVNEMANVGVGTGLIFRDKIGVTFNVKSLIGGTNITVTDNADDITISSTGTSPLTTKGDILAFDTQDARLPVGTAGQILSANPSPGIGLLWIDNVTEVFSWSANHDANGFALEAAVFADGTDITKKLALDLLNMTTGITLTLLSAQTTIQTLTIPDITGSDILVTENFAQTLANKIHDASNDFTAATGLTNFTGLGVQAQDLLMGGFDISGVEIISFDDLNTSIQQSGTFLQIDGALGGTLEVRFNDLANYTFDETALNLVGGKNISIKAGAGTGFIDMGEITTPASPSAFTGRTFVADISGTTTLFFKDSAGNETNLLTGSGIRRAIQQVVVEFTTETVVIDGVGFFHVDQSLDLTNLIDVHAEVITAGTTGVTTIQIFNIDGAVDMLSTPLTIDSGETGSDTAAIPAVINLATDNVALNDLIRIDVDTVSTTPAKGLIVTMGFRLP